MLDTMVLQYDKLKSEVSQPWRLESASAPWVVRKIGH